MKRLLTFLGAAMAAASVSLAASEITAHVVFKVKDGFLDIQRAFNSQFDVAAASPNIAGGTLSVTTNAAQLVSFSPVATNGWTFWRNLDATNVANVVDVGTIDASTNFFPLLRLKPAEYALLRLSPAAAVYVRSVAIAGSGTATNASSRLERLTVDD